MLKIPSKLSISLSVIMSVLFFAVCIGGAVIMPLLAELFIEARNAVSNFSIIEITNSYAFVLILAYMALAIAGLANTLLLFLILNIRKGKVFLPKNITYIRGVSWCCFLIGAVFVLLGTYFYISFALGFVALFIGLCLRIVKNVIEEATEIKGENDLTI